MYLKKIKLLGFKSFADSTILEFHPGITAIVGPNGCGKSNLSDAFRWVLGEQSAKSMRGGKMNDVIFAGTAKRKPLNLAEVSLTLGDAGETLKTEYDEVSVTRRIHRSGESDYFINRNPVRLKDVSDLLLDSGMGKDAYSIFEQGKLDQVINLSPLERRYIFEEAAGILRFLVRKKEALRRLEQTEQNIDRVKDIHREVERQIIVLEQQAEKARIYKEDRAQLEIVETSLAVARWNQFENRQAALVAKEKEKKEEWSHADQLQQQLEIERQNGVIRFNHSMQELHIHKEEVFRVRSQKELEIKAQKTHEERMREMHGKEVQWEGALVEMREKRKLRKVEAEEMREKQKNVEKELFGMDESRQELRESVKILEEELGELRSLQRTEQQELMRVIQAENRVEGECKQHTLRLEHAEERIEGLERRQQARKKEIEETTALLAGKKEEWESGSSFIETQKEVLSLKGLHIQEKTVKIGSIQDLLDRVYQEKAEIKARQNALFRLKEEMEGFSRGAKRLLQEGVNPKSPLYKKVKGLYESFAVEGEVQVALSAIMKSYSQTLIVETAEDFRTVVDFAREHNLRDFSILSLDTLTGDGLVDHFLNKVSAQKTLEEALIALGGEAWTAEGVYVDRNRVVFFPSEEEGNVFLREAELKTLGKKLGTIEDKRGGLEEELKACLLEKGDLQAQKSELDQQIRRAEVKMAEEKYAIDRLEQEIGKASQEWQRAEEERVHWENNRKEVKQAMAVLSAQHATFKSQAQEAHLRVRTLDQQLQEKSEALKLQQQKLQVKESSFQKVADEKRKITHQLSLIDVKDSESVQQERRLEEEIVSLQEKRKEMGQHREGSEQRLQEIECLLHTTLERCRKHEQEVDILREASQHMEEQAGIKREVVRLLEKEWHELGIQSAQLVSSKGALEQEFNERHKISLQEAQQNAVPLADSIDKAERQVRALRRKLEEAGDINMTSIEEFDSFRERYEFLNRQLDDLAASKKELVEIITQLDGESRKIFKETFEQVHRNFKKNFEILFRGGEADLYFTESGDILEAGIEIVAKPPGKQMRSINLLSGGEKCLTAVALLFAIFEVKPAPFCILDEIDAPLDDANVERFLNVVKQFTDRCQFIIITHNKRTMSIADRLYGVSMQEKGVSQILLMEFSQEKAPELVLV